MIFVRCNRLDLIINKKFLFVLTDGIDQLFASLSGIDKVTAGALRNALTSAASKTTTTPKAANTLRSIADHLPFANVPEQFSGTSMGTQGNKQTK